MLYAIAIAGNNSSEDECQSNNPKSSLQQTNPLLPFPAKVKGLPTNKMGFTRKRT